MSTKLYNGLRLAEHAPDLFEVTKIVSKRMREVFREQSAGIIAEFLVSILDKQAVRNLEFTEHRAATLDGRAEALWKKQQSSLNPSTFFHDPLRFNIVFGHVEDASGVRRLAYPFTGRREYQDALLALEVDGKPLFVDYHYQNQSDQPDDIPATAWEQRRTDWDTVLASDDRRTHDTFGHLPHWQLPNTIDDVFDVIWFNRYSYPDEPLFDANRFVSVEERLAAQLIRTLDRKLPQPTDGDPGAVDFAAVRQCRKRIETAIATYLPRPEGQAMPRPEPVPALDQLSIKIEDLPPVYEPPAADLARLVALYEADVADPEDPKQTTESK